MKIDGRFWLTKEGENFLGNGRIKLLKEIEKNGSISKAAKAMKMSYKAAWERVNQMNLLSDFPIIKKEIGGKGGGGTVLTPHAHELIATFEKFEILHRQFIERFSEAGDNPEYLARILGRTFLTTSARNQLLCKIESIQEHGIKGSIKLILDGVDTLYSDITIKSIQGMGLEKGLNAYAIVKSSDLFISSEEPPMSSKYNILKGRVEKIESQGDSTEVAFLLAGGSSLVSVMPLLKSDLLKEGQSAYASISKESIIIGL